MRDIDTIDRELAFLSTVHVALRRMSGHRPSMDIVDQLLDERIQKSEDGAEGR